MADNLATFPYQYQDEPLFLIHQIDILVSVCGSNLLQSYKEVCHSIVVKALSTKSNGCIYVYKQFIAILLELLIYSEPIL